MSRKEWQAFQDGKILVNDTDHYKGGKGMLRDYYRALLYKNIEDMYDALTRDEQMEMCIALINRLTYGNKTRVGLKA